MKSFVLFLALVVLVLGVIGCGGRTDSRSQMAVATTIMSVKAQTDSAKEPQAVTVVQQGALDDGAIVENIEIPTNLPVRLHSFKGYFLFDDEYTPAIQDRQSGVRDDASYVSGWLDSKPGRREITKTIAERFPDFSIGKIRQLSERKRRPYGSELYYTATYFWVYLTPKKDSSKK